MDVVGVIGAGQMGRGIAQMAAEAGSRVLLVDREKQLAEQGREVIRSGLDRLVKKGKRDAGQVDEAMRRTECVADYGALEDANLVIEAATENLQVKLQIFTEVGKHVSSDTIVATNTSSISITQLAAVVPEPERAIGMHFMNPVPVMKLVEIIRGLQTSDSTYARVKQLAEGWGKTVITSRDTPAFLVNRMLVPFLNEACFALQEGVGTVQDIDQGAKLGLNHPMGPFELADFVGLDTLLAIAEVLHRELGEDKYRPAMLLRNYVAAGWLGKKAGRGFYRYDEGSK